jgi:hypothetical protein
LCASFSILYFHTLFETLDFFVVAVVLIITAQEQVRKNGFSSFLFVCLLMNTHHGVEIGMTDGWMTARNYEKKKTFCV